MFCQSEDAFTAGVQGASVAEVPSHAEWTGTPPVLCMREELALNGTKITARTSSRWTDWANKTQFLDVSDALSS